MTAIVGTLQSHGPTREAWGVATVRVETCDDGSAKPGHEVRVVGNQIGMAAPGERLQLEGRWDDGGSYGRQLRVERQASEGIVSEAEAHRWLQRLDGIGPVLAERIHEHCWKLGGALVVLADADAQPDPLLDVEGVSAERARLIRESWAEIALAADPETLAYLDGLKLTRWEADQVLSCAKKHRTTARELLASDPYRLMDMRGIGFTRADKIALAAGLSRVAPARADAAVLHVVGELCEADTHASQSELLRGVCELIGCELALATAAVDRMAEADRIVLRADERKKTWAHPPELLAAEREVLRAIKGGGKRGSGEAWRAPMQAEPGAGGDDVNALLDEQAAEDAQALADGYADERDEVLGREGAEPHDVLTHEDFARLEREWDAARAAEERARPADAAPSNLGALLDALAEQTPGGGEDW